MIKLDHAKLLGYKLNASQSNGARIGAIKPITALFGAKVGAIKPPPGNV